MIVVVAHPFQDGRAEATHAHAVLDGYDAVESATYLVEQFLVERFQESHVVVGHAQSLRLFLHFGYGLGSIVSDRSEGEHSHVSAFLQFSARSGHDFLHGVSPVGEHTVASGVAYHVATVVGQLGRVHQIAQLVLVHRRCDGEVGHRPQRRQVEGPVVCGSVLAHESSPVKTQHHGQTEQRHVVYDVVVGSLCERAVYVAERHESVLCHSCREGDGVSFGYAHVEHSVGHLLHHDAHGASGGHGGRYTHDVVVLPCQFEQGVSEDVLIFGRLVVGVAH